MIERKIDSLAAGSGANATAVADEDEEHLVDVSEDLRIEKSAYADEDGEHSWTVYRRVAVEDGKHPIHKSDTTEEHVWMPVFTGNQEDARKKLDELQ